MISRPLQSIIVVVLTIKYPPKAELQMPVLTEKYVEVACRMFTLSLIVPVTFNLLLIFGCAVLGFFSRNLPDNFNESTYIFFSVITTCVLWIAFIPMYFITPNTFYGSLLLCIVLVVNGYFVFCGLFCPKVYSVLFKSDNDIVLSTFEPI